MPSGNVGLGKYIFRSYNCWSATGCKILNTVELHLPGSAWLLDKFVEIATKLTCL